MVTVVTERTEEGRVATRSFDSLPDARRWLSEQAASLEFDGFEVEHSLDIVAASQSYRGEVHSLWMYVEA